MTYKEKSYVLDTLKEIQETIRSPEFKQLIKETHENNIMLRQIIKVINTWIKHHPQENANDFNMNVIANLISSGLDINKLFKK
jgi:hypothetical protein